MLKRIVHQVRRSLDNSYTDQAVKRNERADESLSRSLLAYAEGPSAFLDYLDDMANEALERLNATKPTNGDSGKSGADDTRVVSSSSGSGS